MAIATAANIDVCTDNIKQQLRIMASEVAVQATNLRDDWKEKRRRLIEEQKARYSPSEEKQMLRDTYSQLNISVRPVDDNGSYEIYWFTSNVRRKGGKKIRKYIPKGESARRTHSYYRPGLYRFAKPWEKDLVKEVEDKAMMLRKEFAILASMRHELKKFHFAVHASENMQSEKLDNMSTKRQDLAPTPRAR